MEAYFDNSATTRVFDSVRDIVVKTMTEDYGNPSAKHRKGMEAEQYVRQAAADIAKTLKVRDKEILFTSGGTESNNMALIGTAMANQRAGKHIISTRIEHASVYNPLAYLEQQGFEVTYLSVDSQGHISLEELEAAIRPDTILVSIMYVNNEVGAIEPVEQIASLIHGKNPAILFHVDAIQAYGKLTIRPKKQGIDLLSVSAHKIHGPKGVGFLYIDEKVKIRPLLYGGGQQKDMRSGTENVPGIAGMGGQGNLHRSSAEGGVYYRPERLHDRPHGIPAGRDRQQPQGNGERAPDCQRKLSGSEKRGPSSRPGGQGNLCFFRIRLFFQSPGNQRNLKGHRGQAGTAGFHAEIQLRRVQHKRRDRLLHGSPGRAPAGAEKVPQRLNRVNDSDPQDNEGDD